MKKCVCLRMRYSVTTVTGNYGNLKFKLKSASMVEKLASTTLCEREKHRAMAYFRNNNGTKTSVILVLWYAHRCKLCS